jgi:hypothetical protein
MIPSDKTFTTFKEFWPHYLAEHSKPWTRRIHSAATVFAVAWVSACLITERPQYALWGLVWGYGPAWISHILIEKNRPATFKHPIWSFLSDLKMLFLTVTGKL